MRLFLEPQALLTDFIQSFGAALLVRQGQRLFQLTCPVAHHGIGVRVVACDECPHGFDAHGARSYQSAA